MYSNKHPKVLFINTRFQYIVITLIVWSSEFHLASTDHITGSSNLCVSYHIFCLTPLLHFR